MTEQAFFTPAELAVYLGVHRQWVYRQVLLNLIPHYRFGGHIRFDKVEIARWAAEQRSDGHGPRRAS